MQHIVCWKILILQWWALMITSAKDPVVETPLGRITGNKVNFQEYVIHEYLGIPYALPPLGDLRFRKPVPLKSFNGSITANRMPPACEQFSYGPYPWYYDGLRDENCLYLNIWVPIDSSKTNIRNKTVMYWMYGGGFLLGSMRQPLFNGTALAALGDVIVVTVNYRVGPFGFLYLGSEEAPGNMGLYDLLEGLKWVNTNIDSFGGNPKSITIFGESSGGIATGLFTVSPLTKGLYKRIILESGTIVEPSFDPAREVNLLLSNLLAASVHCTPVISNRKRVVECMRGVDAKELAKATASLNPHSTNIFFPQYGDEFLPGNGRIASSLHKFHNSELLIGNNQDEGSLFLTTSFPQFFGFHGNKTNVVNNDILMNALKKLIGKKVITALDSTIGTLLDTNNNNNLDPRRQIYTVYGDVTILCPTLFFAEKFAGNGNNVYYYFFTHRPSTTPWAKWMGVAHYEEIQFPFGRPLLQPDEYTESEVLLSKYMIQIWSTFAKTGNPGERWPTFSRENPTFRYLNLSSPSNAEFGSGIHETICGLLRPIYTAPV